MRVLMPLHFGVSEADIEVDGDRGRLSGCLRYPVKMETAGSLRRG